MSDDSYRICYLTDNLSEEDTQSIIDACSSSGFKPPDDNINIGEGQGNQPIIKLSYDKKLKANLAFNLGEDWEWNEPEVIISFSTMPLETSVNVNSNQYTRERVQERVEAILELTRRIVLTIDPEYVWGVLAIGTNPSSGIRPTERPISDNIERIPWILVLSKSVIEDLGGRDHVLETPAWQVETLSTGHIMIVKADNPVDPTKEPKESPDSHLLEQSHD